MPRFIFRRERELVQAGGRRAIGRQKFSASTGMRLRAQVRDRRDVVARQRSDDEAAARGARLRRSLPAAGSAPVS